MPEKETPGLKRLLKEALVERAETLKEAQRCRRSLIPTPYGQCGTPHPVAAASYFASFFVLGPMYTLAYIASLAATELYAKFRDATVRQAFVLIFFPLALILEMFVRTAVFGLEAPPRFAEMMFALAVLGSIIMSLSASYDEGGAVIFGPVGPFILGLLVAASVATVADAGPVAAALAPLPVLIAYAVALAADYGATLPARGVAAKLRSGRDPSPFDAVPPPGRMRVGIYGAWDAVLMPATWVGVAAVTLVGHAWFIEYWRMAVEILLRLLPV